MTEPSEHPKISVVVPIRNEAAFIRQTLAFLLAQDYPHDRMEILVAVGDSFDNTAAIVKEIADKDNRVRYFHNPKQWSSAGRNIGAMHATGDIVTYVDGHTYIDNNQLLKNVAALMAEKNVSVLSRPQFLETPENDAFQQSVALARKSRLGHGTDSTIYTSEDMFVDPSSSGASYKRDVFEQVGYFDERFDAAEDYEFNYRVAKAGYKAFTSLKLAVYYYPRKTLEQLFKQMTRYGMGRARLARKHSETLGPGTLVPPLFVVGLPFLMIAGLQNWFAWVLLILLYGLYGALVVASSAKIASEHGSEHLPRLLLIYPTIHAGLGWGFLKEMFTTVTGGGVDWKQRPWPDPDEL